MCKDFYLSLFPVGDVKWKPILERIVYSTKLNDSTYACLRFMDELNEIFYDNSKILPIFLPNEAIHLDKNIKFRIVIGCPILYDNIDKVYMPWTEDLIPYNEACKLCLDKVISGHSDYVLILRDKYKDDDFIADIIEICLKYNKKYKIIDESERLSFTDIYNYFFK